MNRPWKTWMVFAGCAAVALAVFGWLSRTIIQLDRAQVQALARAELEEHARLALWRLDSSLAPLIVEESARPWSAYEAFSSSETAYTRSGLKYNRAQQGDVLVASPLLAFSSSNILLHFQFRPGQRATSPQVPEGEQRVLAESGYTSPENISAAAARLEQLNHILAEKADGSPRAGAAKSSQGQPRASFDNNDLLVQESGSSNPTATPIPAFKTAGTLDLRQLANPDSRQSEAVQNLRNTSEFVQRANLSQQGQIRAMEDNPNVNDVVSGRTGTPGSKPAIPNESVFKSVWVGQSLVLARQVHFGSTSIVQGVWLNWTNLRPALLNSIADLFPTSELEPAPPPATGNEARLLASLPVKLVPGAVVSDETSGWTPVRLSLAFAWMFVVVAAVAIAFLLHGTLSLSERRAAFVSAVTHELRTPLMTFRMYSEMLAEGMVPDEIQRRQYLSTLCSEATRLSHLVENVLAYARLERQSARRRVEDVSLGQLMERVQPRLTERAALAGLTLHEQFDARAADARLHVDVTAVEQVLFNLVDNACKYAAPTATSKIIHLEALLEKPRSVRIRVRDHGPGLSAGVARHLFQPFSKSADETANTAPGVGLGLALCRGLARSMGGDLRLMPATAGQSGACFELILHVRAPDPATLG
jgi:signal transduction histidine kinase